MKRSTSLRFRGLIPLIIIFLPFISLQAQVGIGNVAPNSDALLEVGDGTDTQGILLPRVALTMTTSPLPMTADVAGMVVYNTAIAGDVTPGFYYNDGANWVRLGSGSAGNDWSLTGNGGTTAGTNFIGTTDNIALRIKTVGSDAFDISNGSVANRGKLRAYNSGTAAAPTYSWSSDTDIGMYRIAANTLGFSATQASINGNPVFLGDRFTVNGAAGEYAVNGYSSTSGVGVYGDNTGTGYGVWGDAANIGVYGSGGAGVYGDANNATGFGAIAINSNATGTGLLASGTNSIATYLTSGTGIAANGANGIFGYGRAGGGTGIIGTGNNSTMIVTSSTGSGVAGSGTRNGVFGYAGLGTPTLVNRGNRGGEFILDTDNNVTTNGANNGTRASAILAGFDNIAATGSGGLPVLSAADSYYGGYFSGGNENNGTPSYAYVGLRHNTSIDGSSGTDYKIIGPGSVSTIINDAKGVPRIMFAPEAPEIVFQDYGIGKLINGQARIQIDPLLKESLFVDDNHPLKVFVTLEGDCNGVFVTDKSVDGFTVKELNNGRSNVSFSWQIVANRADSKDALGKISSKHVGLRLPEAPGPIHVNAQQIETKDKQTNSLKLNSGSPKNTVSAPYKVSDSNESVNDNKK
jgi:hypothetical protein